MTSAKAGKAKSKRSDRFQSQYAVTSSAMTGPSGIYRPKAGLQNVRVGQGRYRKLSNECAAANVCVIQNFSHPSERVRRSSRSRVDRGQVRFRRREEIKP